MLGVAPHKMKLKISRVRCEFDKKLCGLRFRPKYSFANIRGRQARAQAAADGAAATKVQASIRGRQARTRVRSGWTPPAGHLHDENFGGENTSALFQGWMRSRVDGARALADGEASANARPPAEESAALFGEWMKALVQNASKRAESARTDRTAPAQPRKEFHPSAYL